MASGININAELLISRIRILDINNVQTFLISRFAILDINNANC